MLHLRVFRVRYPISDQEALQVGFQFQDTFEHGGVYEGDAFEAWLKDILDNYGVSDNSSLETKMSWKDVDLVCTERWIKAFYGEEFMDKLAQLNDTAAPPMLILEHLVLVASDVSARKIAIFPQESYDYWPKGAHPATYARASMSIPGFFVPKVATGPNAVEGVRFVCPGREHPDSLGVTRLFPARSSEMYYMCSPTPGHCWMEAH